LKIASEKLSLKLAFIKVIWFIIIMNKVLIVDDEEPILKGIKLNLGRTFDLTLSTSAKEALNEIRQDNSFEVVVSDMRMPGMDGATMLKKIKEENPAIMTILLTGHADFEFGGSQALQSGLLFKILTKPCPPQKLSAAINAAISARNVGKQEEEQAPDGVL
jgi:DNA-binding NtrC family response regulator